MGIPNTAVLTQSNTVLSRLITLLLLLTLAACSSSSSKVAVIPFNTLDNAYRINLNHVDVVYDLDPKATYIDGHAELSFTMRTGQKKPIFHFNPWMPYGQSVEQRISQVLLDGQPIAVNSLKRIRFEGSDLLGFEIDRIINDSSEHRLEVSWSLWNWFARDEPGQFRTAVDDISGLGNEVLWPTINSPEEQARHTITFKVDSDEDYTAVGSPNIQSRYEDGIQIFHLDTEREVASYTVMFAVLPASRANIYHFDVDGFPVRLVSTVNAETDNQAINMITTELRKLKNDFGELKVPSAEVFLINWHLGMEYFGAVTSGIGSLQHELTHLYWGTVAVNTTWRDGWMDEAINVWYNTNPDPVPNTFSSDLLGGHHPLKLGFDQRAYYQGARVISAAAERMGRPALIDFLAKLYEQRAFDPYTTDDFITDLVIYTGDSTWPELFDQWVGNSYDWENSNDEDKINNSALSP